MVERRYSDDELQLLEAVASGELIFTSPCAEKLISDGLIHEDDLYFAITDAGRRVIGEA